VASKRLQDALGSFGGRERLEGKLREGPIVEKKGWSWNEGQEALEGSLMWKIRNPANREGAVNEVIRRKGRQGSKKKTKTEEEGQSLSHRRKEKKSKGRKRRISS